MPFFEEGGRRLYYEVSGPDDASTLLLIAPGGMKSTISFWSSTPWNPIEQLKDRFRVVAMDQRNAGQSTAPVSANDGWQTYTRDHLDLMDHLGAERFHVAGMCIGGPYALGLIQAAPDRVLSATLFQTIGRDNNQAEFYAMFDDWAAPLMAQRDQSADEWQSFREAMYGGEALFFNVDLDFVQTVQTPLLVLEGNDVYHPRSSSVAIGEHAPNVTYISDWKDGPARDAAMVTFADFVEANS